MSTIISGDTGVSKLQDDTVGTNAIVDESITVDKIDPAILADVTTSVLMPAQSATGVASLSFDDIPAWASRYQVIFSGVSLVTQSPIIIKVATTAGVISTGYNSSIAGISSATVLAAITSPVSGIVISSGAGTYESTGIFTFESIDGVELVGTGVFSLVGNSAAPVTVFCAGRIDPGDKITRIIISSVDGTYLFDNGTISVRYEGEQS